MPCLDSLSATSRNEHTYAPHATTLRSRYTTPERTHEGLAGPFSQAGERERVKRTLGLLSVLFGRNKLRRPSRERFFSIVAAELSLSERSDLRSTHKAGIVFNPVESTFFDNLDSEVRDLLRISGHATGTRYEIVDDTYGTRWVVLDDRDFEDLVATIHLVGETITDQGFGDRLLAAAFGFEYEGKRAYWVYGIKRGSFYPIVLAGRPGAGQRRRDAAGRRHGGGQGPRRARPRALVRPLGNPLLAPCPRPSSYGYVEGAPSPNGLTRVGAPQHRRSRVGRPLAQPPYHRKPVCRSPEDVPTVVPA